VSENPGAKRVAKLFQGAWPAIPCSAGDGRVENGLLMTDGTVWHQGCWDAERYPLISTPITIRD
jgi:hypothetical protein